MANTDAAEFEHFLHSELEQLTTRLVASHYSVVERLRAKLQHVYDENGLLAGSGVGFDGNNEFTSVLPVASKSSSGSSSSAAASRCFRSGGSGSGGKFGAAPAASISVSAPGGSVALVVPPPIAGAASPPENVAEIQKILKSSQDCGPPPGVVPIAGWCSNLEAFNSEQSRSKDSNNGSDAEKTFQVDPVITRDQSTHSRTNSSYSRGRQSLNSAASSRRGSLSKQMLTSGRSSLASGHFRHGRRSAGGESVASFHSGQDWLHGKLQAVISLYNGSSEEQLQSDTTVQRQASRWHRCFRSTLMTAPGSLRHFTWECLAVVMVFFEIFALPLQMLQPEPSSFLCLGSPDYTFNIQRIARIFWTLNIPISFTTGIMNDRGVVIMELCPIALHYATTWMPLDALALAMDWLEELPAVSASTWWLAVARLTRMLRVFRLAHLVTAHDAVPAVTARSERLFLVGTIVNLMAIMAWTTHTIACLLYYIGNFDSKENNAEAGWVVRHDVQTLTFRERYAWCFHCALGLFNGEHVVWPSSYVERCFTVSVLFFTFIISASFVSSLTTAMTRLHLITNQRAHQKTFLNRYLSDNKISQQLAYKVRRNAQHAAEQQSRRTPEESVELLAFVSEPLRQEIRFEIYGKVLCSHPFFEFYGDLHPLAVRKICHDAILRLPFSRGDVVFADQEVPAEPRMYFIVEGMLDYEQSGLHDDQKEVSTQCSGSWMCEAVLWTRWKHRGTLTATLECDVFALVAQSFHRVTAEFPNLELRAYARAFVETLRTSRRLTDASIATHRLSLLAGRAFSDGAEAELELQSKCNQELDPEELAKQELSSPGLQPQRSGSRMLNVGVSAGAAAHKRPSMIQQLMVFTQAPRSSLRFGSPWR
eukprot:TRINITY_DN21399_c0_g2_i1.p1 TRINITY_DN21399_c0_g2~~TRINITY_DN21399_c0_g2_i1.p1  ORF type:complete len:876 (-),score=167.38 TRINITY_DN21399_c0_g2_i1:67-2694(-)